MIWNNRQFIMSLKLVLAKVPCGLVAVSIPAGSANGQIFDELLAGRGVSDAKGIHETATYAALYMAIKQSLFCDGTMLSSVLKVCGSIIHGEFNIGITTAPTASAVKAAIRKSVASMNPVSLYSTYAILVGQSGEKPSKEFFNYVAGDILDTLKKIVVYVCSKSTSLKESALSKLISAALKKAIEKGKPAKGQKPEIKKDFALIEPKTMVSLPDSIEGYFVVRFIESALKVPVRVGGKFVLVAANPGKVTALAKEAKISRFATRLLRKLKKKPNLYHFAAGMTATVPVSTLVDGKQPTIASVTSAIKKSVS